MLFIPATEYPRRCEGPVTKYVDFPNNCPVRYLRVAYQFA